MARGAARSAWFGHLMVTDKGKIIPNLANVMTVLREEPAFADAFGFDKLLNETMVTGPLPWTVNGHAFPRMWSETDDTLLAEWMQRAGVQVSSRMVREAVETVSHERSYHPILQYLSELIWDGVERLDTWAIDYLGCDDNPYVRGVSACWPISAIARVRQPGCKADSCLILEGPQNLGKSRLLRKWGEPWFTDEMAAMGTNLKNSRGRVKGLMGAT
jgi:putative DNA primase/helicase